MKTLVVLLSLLADAPLPPGTQPAPSWCIDWCHAQKSEAKPQPLILATSCFCVNGAQMSHPRDGGHSGGR